MNLDSYPLLCQNKATLKETSKDTSNKDSPFHMTESERVVFDFDEIKRQYLLSLGIQDNQQKSFDAILEHNGRIHFIEFKNGGSKKDIINSIKGKVSEGLLIFCDIVSTSISFTRKYADFIVVYNAEKVNKSAKVKIQNHVEKKSSDPYGHFGIAKYRGLYFRDAKAFSMEQFEDFLGRITDGAEDEQDSD